jgi:hypothetical protein
MAGHAGADRRDAGERGVLDGRVAEPAVEAQLAGVMLVAERDRLLADDQLFVDIRTPVQKLIDSGRRDDDDDQADKAGLRKRIRGLGE